MCWVFIFLPGETWKKWNLLSSICPFSTFLLLLKWTHLSLKSEHRSWNAAQLNPTYVGGLGWEIPICMDFQQTAPSEEGFLLKWLSIPTVGGSCCLLPALCLWQQGHSQDTKFCLRYQITHMSLNTGATLAPCLEDHGDTHPPFLWDIP